jgi:hypothetical protein
MAELMAKLLGPDPTIAALAADIHARTGGNPFFAEELRSPCASRGNLKAALARTAWPRRPHGWICRPPCSPYWRHGSTGSPSVRSCCCSTHR